MTILYAGGEDTSFTLFGPANTGILAGNRTGYARTVLECSANTGTADPPVNRWQSPTFTPTSTLWFHAQVYQHFGSSTLNQQAIILRSPDGVARIVVRQTTTAGQLKISTRNAAGTITDLGTAASTNLVADTTTALDLFVNYTAAGGCTLYLNGTAVITYTGDPRTDAATQLNQVEFANLAISGGGVTATETCWSEIIIADQDTRSMALFTMAPQAAGNTQAWTPNTLANINKPAINDTTLISSSASNQLSEWTQPTALPTGSWTVNAVVQNARVQTATTGPQNFDWIARSAGTDYLAGTPQAPPLAFANFQHLWSVNPATGVAWTVGDITAAGFNLGIESQAGVAPINTVLPVVTGTATVGSTLTSTTGTWT